MEQVAKHLVLKYPSFGDVRRQERGWEMWFFHTPFAPAATGFLEERLKSQRKKINKKTPTKNLQVVLFNENSLSWNSDDDGENINFIHFPFIALFILYFILCRRT